MCIALARAGIERIVINLAWLGSQIREYLGDGARYGVSIVYSEERRARSRPPAAYSAPCRMLAPGPFAVVNGDVYTDFPFETLKIAAGRDAHLVLVPNPPQHPHGDFGLEDGDRAGRCRRAVHLFRHCRVSHRRFSPAATDGVFPLKPLLLRSMAAGRCSAELYTGVWEDVGTPERLQALNAQARLLELEVQSRACRISKAYPSCKRQPPTRSGDKYTTAQGFTAIKDGIKQGRGSRRRNPR